MKYLTETAYRLNINDNMRTNVISKNKTHILAVPILFLGCLLINGCNSRSESSISKNAPDIPHIDFIEMSAVQYHKTDTTIIWYDDFNHGKKDYLESTGDIDTNESFGGNGGAMKAGFTQGEINGEGNRKLAFGDFPGPTDKVVKPGAQFDEIFWRIYVKHEYGWEGAPAKMSRATSIVSEKWLQAMIAHVWSGQGNSLTLDPASGVDGQSSTIKTTTYNDFENIKWLGNKPSSEFQISSTESSGYWILVESQVKLNTPGLSDGENRLWIDGRLEVVRENLNFRGSYTEYGINAVFLESYWNDGSVKTQSRWYDNFVVSTKPIGSVFCPSNPVLNKTTYHGPEQLSVWEIELALDNKGKNVIYKSDKLKNNAESIIIDVNNGSFTGSFTGTTHLKPNHIYFCKIRQQSTNGLWSNWSRWHQPFRVKGKVDD